MQINIEFLGADKKGQTVVLGESISDMEPPAFDILENDAISVTFISEVEFSKVLLLLGDREFECTSSLQNNGYVYKWMPERFERGYKALFHNFFGIAELAIKIVESGNVTIRKLKPIEIFSNAMAAGQCENMLNYLAANRNLGLLNSLSPLGFNAMHVRSGISPTDLIDHMCKTVLDVEAYCKGILKNPLSKIRSKILMVDGLGYDSIDESSVAWIAENSSVLTKAESIECAHFRYENEWYFASEVQSSRLFNSTDIYENKLIHFFIKKLRFHCKNKLLEIKNTKRSNALNKSAPYGFVSFYEVMNRITGRNLDKKLEKLNSCMSKLDGLNSLLVKRVPISHVDIGKISLTERIKANKNYFGFYKTAIAWIDEREIDWSAENLLAHINSADKLFELYCCVAINDYLLAISSSCRDANQLFCGTVKGMDVNFYYEPKYWKSGHRNGKGEEYVNTDLKYEKAKSPDQHKEVTGYYSRRTPDFVIEIEYSKNGSTNKELLIFDAKYTRADRAFNVELVNCTMKYVHGIHRVNGENVVKMMVIIHPENDHKNNPSGSYLDFHAKPFDLVSSKTVFPILGTQSVLLSREGEEPSLQKTLNRVFELVSGN